MIPASHSCIRGRSGRTLAAVMIPLLLLPSLLVPQPLREFRAVKLTNVDSNVLFTDQNIADAMDYLASIGVNVILPVVWNAAYTQYQSGVMDSLFGAPIHPQFAGRDPLRRLVIEAHRVGIEVYPWFEYGFAAWYSGSGTATGGHIVQKFPQWASRNPDGSISKKNGFDWLSPLNPDVQKFINALVSEVITKYDVDGVEFSDRIPAMPVEGGYDSVTVALYKQDHGGNTPPVNARDAAWMRWRADRMNQWYAGVRAIIKARSPHLFVSSSPSIYPWSYQEYLQDVQGWITGGIADHFIPQLYRYSFSEYAFELQNAIGQAGVKKNILFPGILMNLGTGAGEYVIPADYLMKAMAENRKQGINGEAFFYYEGLRKNNGRLGDTLKATFYKEKALVPERGDHAWRPPAVIVNETDASVAAQGAWSQYLMKGYQGAVLRSNDSLPGAVLTYTVTVPAAGYYDLFTYRVPNTPWNTKARYTVRTSADSQIIQIDQSDLSKKGWQLLGTFHLNAGPLKLLTLDNSQSMPGRYTVADAVMLTINRTLSPDAVLTAAAADIPAAPVPETYCILENYPNPFNPSTLVRYSVPADGNVRLTVFDLLGREVRLLADTRQRKGEYTVPFHAEGLSAGVYFAHLSSGPYRAVRKLLLTK